MCTNYNVNSNTKTSNYSKVRFKPLIYFGLEKNLELKPLRIRPPWDNYCCGWYASYWNAFLLKRLFPCPDIKNLNKPHLHSGIKCINKLPPYPFNIRYICTFLLDIYVSCIHTLTLVFNVSHPHTLMLGV